jgi:hypothetical protein
MPAPKKTLKSAITDGSALQAMVKGKNASWQAGTQAYPAVEISMRDTSKTQAMEAMRHIERSRPGLTSGATPRISLDPTGQGTSSILNYIQELERKIAALQAAQGGQSGPVPHPQINLEERLEGGDGSMEALSSPDPVEERLTLLRTPESPRPNPWIVDIKRYKKLNYRFGSAELYDDSENIDEIRARESAARGGGYVIKLYREYDCEC